MQLLRLLRRTSAEVECVVEGVSMSDAIPDGACVRLRLDGAADAGQQTAVALLLGSDTFTVHRLVRRGRSPRARDFVLTHGDGNIFCDAPQRVSDLLGTVVALRRPDHPHWTPVPPARRRGPFRGALTLGFERLMVVALELTPRLGFVLKNALVLLLTPVAWLRPRQPGVRRSTSRLVGLTPVAPR